MCFSKPNMNTTAVVQAQQEVMKEQLNKSNAVLSNERTASTTGEKISTKRTINSLRVPFKNTTDTSTTGINTANTTTGLNIPV
nr:MAG TPA: hypothetical protein [Caudoviricetes sp.]